MFPPLGQLASGLFPNGRSLGTDVAWLRAENHRPEIQVDQGANPALAR
jgi:hypothetical protein